MSLWKIAWRSIRQRTLASTLTALSMAMGVTLVVAVLSIHGIVSESFNANTQLGYNMIVGAEGGKLQLTVNSVFYLSSPVENIPYDYYLEFLDPEQRDQHYQHSIQMEAHDAAWEATHLAALSTGSLVPSLHQASGLALGSAAESTSVRHVDLGGLIDRPVAGLAQGRSTSFGEMVELAIPLCLGDYFGRFRVVGTTPDLLGTLKFGPEADRSYEFASGRNFKTHSEEHGYFEAVVGARVAREMEVSVGDEISVSHGATDEEASQEEKEASLHDQKFTVVGILDSSGTPQDRAVFINIEGFYLMSDHAKPVETGFIGSSQVDVDHETPLPVEQREVTAILLRTGIWVAGPMENIINESGRAQAVLPIREIFNLFDAIVRPIQRVMLVLTALICFVSGVSILVSIYNSMNDRRHEIAVMRALGASRGTVMSVILLESVFLALAGGVGGWIGGHGLNWMASGRIEEQTGVSIGFFDLAPAVNVLELFGQEPTIQWLRISTELLIIPGLIGLAIVVGFIPALSAYRTDVAKSLGA